MTSTVAAGRMVSRWLIVLSLCLATLDYSVLFANDTDQQTRCKSFMAQNPDLVCLSLSAARALDVRLAQADHDLSIAKLKSRHLGLTLGCGLGVAAFVTDSWTTKALPAASCGAYYGWRF